MRHLVLLGALVWAPLASAQPTNVWNHNGSIVSLEMEGTQRAFYYQQPRPGMFEAGARQGALLFAGTRTDFRYVGTAYVFSATCGPVGYQVEGALASNLKFIRLAGQVPLRDTSCNIVSYRTDVLTFEALTPRGCYGTCEGCPQEIAIADTIAYYKDKPGYSCPYLYAWSNSATAWKAYGKVIHVAEGRSREVVEEVSLTEFSTKFRLSEHEPENSYIDRVQLKIQVKDGSILVLKPNNHKLSYRDGNYLFLAAFKSVEFDFSMPRWIAPSDVRDSSLIITGYYERVLPPRLCLNPQISSSR